MIESIIILGLIFLVFQMLMSTFQIKYYQKFMRDLVSQYKDTNYMLRTEVNKSLFSSNILAVILDGDQIIDAYELKGVSIFSKFKPLDHLKGHVLSESGIADSKISKAQCLALQKIYEKL